MADFVIFVAVMSALVVGLALLSVAFAVMLSICIRAFRGNAS